MYVSVCSSWFIRSIAISKLVYMSISTCVHEYIIKRPFECTPFGVWLLEANACILCVNGTHLISSFLPSYHGMTYQQWQTHEEAELPEICPGTSWWCRRCRAAWFRNTDWQLSECSQHRSGMIWGKLDIEKGGIVCFTCGILLDDM